MKKNVFIKLILILCLFLSVGALGNATVWAATNRGTDVTVASPGNTLITVDGTFVSPGKQRVLDRINQIRQEAAREGLADKYVPIKWSYDLEVIAQTRAAEAYLHQAHQRPSGKDTFSISSNGVSSFAENLAWNYAENADSMMKAIEQFYSEKADYVTYKKTGVSKGQTGHYVSMINPAYNHMGMGTFIGDRRYFHTSAQAFSHKTGLNESATGQYGAFSQTIEVQSNRLSNIKIESKNSAIGAGAPETATLSGTVIVDGFQNGSVTAHFPAVHWSSSNGTIAQVDSNGMITGLNSGSVTITARSGGVSATKTFTVKAIQSIHPVSAATKAGTAVVLPKTVTAIWSDGSKTQEVVTWPAVDVTNAGTTAKTVTVNGKIGKSSLPAKAIVTVQGISSVENASVATKSTVAPNLPAMVKVTWTDKSTSTEKVTWSALKPTDYTSNAKKVVTVSGTVAKTNLKSKLFLTVHAITSVSKPAISTKSGTAPALPATVKATWTDGSTTNETVKWSAVRATDYTSHTKKAFQVSGVVSKTNLTSTASVTVHAITRLSSPSVSTKTGIAPLLPTGVTAIWSDGTTTVEKVTWSALKAVDYTSATKKNISVAGAVAKINLKATATVTIHTIANLTPVKVSTISKQAPILPATVKATWTDGSVTEEAVVWPALIPEQYTSLIGEKVVMVEGGLKKTSLKAVATIQIMSEGIAMYRLYNRNNLEHFYTASLNERDTLVRIGWGVNEGIGWYAPASGAPVYRLYNKTLKDHHYTTSENEKNVLVAKHGWTYEGIAWYSGGSKPLYRLYNPKLKSGSHHYTTSENERDVLVSKHGWKYEGIAWYGIK